MPDPDPNRRLSADPLDLLTIAGHEAGVPTENAALIRDGTNIIYDLPGGIVARIGPPCSHRNAGHQLQASRWLNSVGIPAVRAIHHIDQPTLVGSRAVTWWRRIPDHRHATPAELGTLLRGLHALDVPDRPSLPTVDPFEGLDESIEHDNVLADEDRAWLRHLIGRLRGKYSALKQEKSPCVIHGDAWQGNAVVPTAGGEPVLLDLDHLGIGLPEWDLVSLAVEHTDFARITDRDYQAFVHAYGGYDMTTWHGYRTLATVRELQWTTFVLGKARTNVEAAQEARHRVACLRGEIEPPWLWSLF